MSTIAKPQSSANPTPNPPRPATTTVRKTVKVAKPEYTFLFDRENYMLMAGGVALILIGFMLMSGGKSPNPHEFNYAEIYSIRRITIAPITILLGFAVEVFAIMKKPKEVIEETTTTTTTTTV